MTDIDATPPSKSIKDLIPIDISGRHARKGFIYQDHVAVGFCIIFLTDPNLKEIWLESHDDIMLIWESEKNPIVEFIQVKAVDRKSRWSVPSMCGDGVIEDSIIKKLLDQDRCIEKVLFRVVSSSEVNVDLAILKYNLSSLERKTNSRLESDLGDAIIKKMGDIKSPNGKTVHDFIRNCVWEKKADDVKDLESSNKIALEKALSHYDSIFPDQRDEIYQKMLRFCQLKSSDSVIVDPDCYKITRTSFLEWLESAISAHYIPKHNTIKLEEKLSRAKNITTEYIPNAVKLKWNYKKQRLNNDFIGPSEMSLLESVIEGELYKLKISLDNEDIEEDNFHKLCIDKLGQINELPAFKNIPSFLLTGFMYDLTSKCLHRFRRVEA